MSDGADADPVATDSALAALLRSISRDVAHELRGPVQSVVVNLEVLKLRAARGEMADVESRAAILEGEVRRLHGLADAFVALLDPAPFEAATMPAETLLARADPLLDVIARSRRVTLERVGSPPDTLVRTGALHATLALVLLTRALCDMAGPGGRVSIASETDGNHVRIILDAGPAEGGAAGVPERDTAVADALPAAAGWLRQAGGTVDLETGSERARARILVCVPRAT